MSEPQSTVILFLRNMNPNGVEYSKKLQYIVETRSLELLFISHHIDSVTVHCQIVDDGKVYNGHPRKNASPVDVNSLVWRDHQRVRTIVDDRTVGISYRHSSPNFWQFLGLGKGEVTGEAARNAAYAFYFEFIIKQTRMREWLAQYLPEEVEQTLENNCKLRGRRALVRIWKKPESKEKTLFSYIVLRNNTKERELTCIPEAVDAITAYTRIEYSKCMSDPEDPLSIKHEEVELEEGKIAGWLLSEHKEIRTLVAKALERVGYRKEIRKELNLT